MIAWILTGIFGISIFMGIYKNHLLKTPLLLSSLLLAFIGSIILLYLYYVYPHEEQVSYKIIAMIVGELMFIFGIHNINAFFRCKTEIPATYVKYNTYYGSRGITTQVPVFEYTYNGQKYIGQSSHTESYKYLEQNMRIGNSYTIYLNHKNPHIFILRKKIGYQNILMLAFGLFFLLTFLIL